jgi:hypothetical protein
MTGRCWPVVANVPLVSSGYLDHRCFPTLSKAPFKAETWHPINSPVRLEYGIQALETEE